jgi:uncharacterized protein YciI
MKRIFAVVRTRGKVWDDSLPLEGQREWKAHAAFMDGLHAEGFALLVGPLEGAAKALLIIRAENADEINARLADDPWTHNGLLRTTEIWPWTLRLGSLG